jgi:nucleotide-binding universal stress UspA family protein
MAAKPPFRTIVVPIDRSEPSKAAIPHAAALARAFAARIRLLLVAEQPPVLPIPEESLIGVEGWLPTAEDRERTRAELERLAAATPALAGLDVVASVRSGAPADEIVREVEASGADLIVLATRGKSGLSRFLLGSVADKVTLGAPCSVLSIRPPQPARAGVAAVPAPPAKPRRILVPTDLSDHSYRALPVAAAIAERFDAEVALLAVLEDPTDHPEIRWEERAGISAEEVKARTAEATRERMRAAVEKLKLSARVRRIEVGFGRPAATLVERAEAEGFDLIAMASRGSSALTRAILGSVARDVVRHAHCPVLAVRP